MYTCIMSYSNLYSTDKPKKQKKSHLNYTNHLKGLKFSTSPREKKIGYEPWNSETKFRTPANESTPKNRIPVKKTGKNGFWSRTSESIPIPTAGTGADSMENPT